MTASLYNKQVLVTGADGFIGKHLVNALENAGATVFVPAKRHEPNGVDLTNREHVDNCFHNVVQHAPLDFVYHCAGHNGGVQKNFESPADIFYRNTVMGLNVLDACARYGVKKVVCLVTSCAYSPSDEPLAEADFHANHPHDSVACHGFAKRNLQMACEFYSKQHGLLAVCACPNHVYGPGCTRKKDGKVLESLIQKFAKAKKDGLPSVTLFGTGAARREFIYVDDCVRLLMKTMELYEDTDIPINIASGQEITIRELAEMVKKEVGYAGEVCWGGGLEGQMRKKLDLTRMFDLFGPQTFVSLEEGIRRTVEDYFA